MLPASLPGSVLWRFVLPRACLIAQEGTLASRKELEFFTCFLKSHWFRRKEALVTEGLSFPLPLTCGVPAARGLDPNVGLKEGGDTVPLCAPGLRAQEGELVVSRVTQGCASLQGRDSGARPLPQGPEGGALAA